MSELKDETIEMLAKLSRIAVTDEEKKSLHKDLDKIIDFVELLDELDIQGSYACNQVIKDHKHLMRDDEVKNLLPRDSFLKNAPDHMGGLVKTPPIIIKD